MKCCQLVAALALALVGCGLNTSAVPSTGRSEDAGISSTDSPEDKGIAGSPANWPTRRRPSMLGKDGGSSDTTDAAKPGGGAPTTGDKDATTDPGQSTPGGSSNPSNPSNPSTPNPSSNGGSSKPGGQAQPNGSAGNGSSSSGGGQADAGAPDAGWSDPDDPDDDDGHSDEDDHSGNGSNGSGSNGGQSPSGPSAGDTIDIIVDLVIAILDLSLGPIRPAEIEGLVSAILVLSLAPAELAADSLIAVLDALEDTRICAEHPERCNPLCTNLESDCSACGKDHDCIERIEEMCKVKLPRSCF